MEKIHWAPKIRPEKIRDLYTSDAVGIAEEELAEDVGARLEQRCRSIRIVTNRTVECPRCGAIFSMCEPGGWKTLPGRLTCPAGCSWETSAEEWHASWQHRDLLGTAAAEIVESYLERYPRARTYQERMVCIDELIHAFHVSLQSGKLNRSVANNLIEGSHDQVVELLDGLFARAGGVDKEEWREHVRAMFQRRRGETEG